MADITQQQPKRADNFTVTEKVENLFQQAAQAHSRFEDNYQTLMATPARSPRHASQGMECVLGEHKLLMVAQRYYDTHGLNVLNRAIHSLEGQERSSILMVAESPLRIIPEASHMGMPDILGQAIAKEARIRVHVPVTSLSDLSVIGEAISIGIQNQVDRIDILGAVVNSVAHPLNLGTAIDIKTGVEEMRQIVSDDVGILDLYNFADEALNLSPSQMRNLSQIIDNASRQAGHVEDDGQVISRGLYDKEILSDILNNAPEHRASILGFAVCTASEKRPSPDIGMAIHTCFEAWGGQYSALLLHEGVISISKYVEDGATRQDSAALAYMKKADNCLQQAKFNHIERELTELVTSGDLPRNILVISDLHTAPAYNRMMASLLRVKPTDITYY